MPAEACQQHPETDVAQAAAADALVPARVAAPHSLAAARAAVRRAWAAVRACWTTHSVVLGGLVTFAVSTLFTTLMAATAKLATEAGMPVWQVVFLRSALLVLYTTPQMVYHRFDPLQGPNMRRFVSFLRGILGTGAVAFIFMAVQLLPFAETIMLTFLSPVFVAVLAPVLLREPLNWAVTLAIPFCIGGVLLVAQPPSVFRQQRAAQGLNPVGVAFALAQAFCSGTSKMCIRYLCRTDPVYSAMWTQGVLSTLLSLILCTGIVPGQAFANPSPRAWGLGVATSLLGVANQITSTAALHYAPAAAVTAMTYTSVIWGLLIDLAMFRRFPNALALGGAAIICAATLSLSLWTHFSGRRKAPPPAAGGAAAQQAGSGGAPAGAAREGQPAGGHPGSDGSLLLLLPQQHAQAGASFAAPARAPSGKDATAAGSLGLSLPRPAADPGHQADGGTNAQGPAAATQQVAGQPGLDSRLTLSRSISHTLSRSISLDRRASSLLAQQDSIASSWQD